MDGPIDSKDGLRELIEMRNNKRNMNRNLAYPSDSNNMRTDSVLTDSGNVNTADNGVGSPDSVSGELALAENLSTHDDDDLPKLFKREDSVTKVNRETISPEEFNHDDAYDAQPSEMSDNNLCPPNDNLEVPNSPDDQKEDEKGFDDNWWVLPDNRVDCTLEEIRRGQVINQVAPNECPVMGCGKKINEMRIEPSPGTIASGLRTHVLFVHYANRKINKKRKLGWTSSKRRNQASPKKQIGGLSSAHSSPSTSKLDLDMDIQNSNPSDLTSSVNLLQKEIFSSRISPHLSGDLLNKKMKTPTSKPQALQMSSLQSLIQATGGSKTSPPTKQKMQESNGSQKNFNPTTSSLFSILAGLTQQQQLNQSQPAISRNVKTAQGTNTINISQCSRNPLSGNRTVTTSSSLLSLLNEQISGNVATSLQSQLKKSLESDSRNKISTSTPRPNISTTANLTNQTNSPYYQTSSELNLTNSSSILNNLCSVNSDNRLSLDNSMPLNSFIESIAVRTGSSIGPAGVAEAKKIIEKFTTSLICAGQTIADHYLAGDALQQKPEISTSDLLLAYKMMYKSNGF